MRNLSEIDIFLKQRIKGTAFEPLARFVADIIKPPPASEIVNRQDNVWTNQIMQRVLSQNSNCIDVGCYMGEFLSQMSHLAPAGSHYAFEPIPNLATRLRKRFPHVAVQQTALSNVKAKKTFWHVLNAPALSSLEKQICDSRLASTIAKPLTVETAKLDDMLSPDFQVDFIKVDVEGTELQFFQGARRTIETYKPYIVFEHGVVAPQAGGDRQYHGLQIYHLLVEQCAMRVFELKSWLTGLPPLSSDGFATAPVWNFLATP